MHRNLCLAISVLIAFAFAGCSESPDTIQGPQIESGAFAPTVIDDPCGEVTTVTLFAGQTIDVGTVVVANDGERLCVTYNATGTWFIQETHLHIGLTLSDIPQTRSGNPRPGQFMYAHRLSTPAQTDEFCFSMEELGYTSGATLYIAAHAVVVRREGGRIVQNETAWGDGTQFSGANWATYLEHTVQECGGGGEFTPQEYVTYTPAQWGGDDPRAEEYLEQHFPSCIGEGGLVLGCVGAGYEVVLTTAEAVEQLLPASGIPGMLLSSYTNPALTDAQLEDPEAQATEAGELLGQIVALSLNVQFELCDTTFATGQYHLADLTVCSPMDPYNPVAGWTVQEVLDEAMAILGGCDYDYVEADVITQVLKAINENFVPGSSAGSYLCGPGGAGGE